MIKMSILSATAALALVTLSGSVSAKPALKDVTVVSEGIITVGIAYEISQKCDSIRARTLRGLSFLSGLKDHARSLGYSEDEIDAYVDDRAEKNRLETIARARLSDMGAVPGDDASFCAVGRNEVSNGSSIGRLLR
jgi:hypothetical protein